MNNIADDLVIAFNDGYEKGKSDAEAYIFHCGDPKPKTNADRIRRMTNEELAKAFTDDLCELLCGSPSVCDGDCDRRMFDWLNKECE